jgi:hypothetical protein
MHIKINAIKEIPHSLVELGVGAWRISKRNFKEENISSSGS